MFLPNAYAHSCTGTQETQNLLSAPVTNLVPLITQSYSKLSHMYKHRQQYQNKFKALSFTLCSFFVIYFIFILFISHWFTLVPFGLSGGFHLFPVGMQFHSGKFSGLLLFDSLFHLSFWSEASVITSLDCHYTLLPLHTSSVSRLPAWCIMEHSDRLMSTCCLSLFLSLPPCRVYPTGFYGDLCCPVNK